jgi:hypothetical protein
MQLPTLNDCNIELFEAAADAKFEDLQVAIKNSGKNVLTLDNFIDDVRLNELGLQVYRALIFDQKFEESRSSAALAGSEYHKQLQENGYILLEDFIDEEPFNQIVGAVKQVVEGSGGVSANLPLQVNVGGHSLLQDICRLCQADNSFSLASFYLRQIIHMEAGEYSEDARQYNYHYDKFFPNYKIWHYPFEMNDADGPTGCYRGSHKNSLEKLRWYKEISLKHESMALGAWSRISPTLDHTDHPSSAAKLGFNEEVLFSGKPNTFFVIDTRCFHRRSPSLTGSPRVSLRAILPRDNIFDK